MKGFLTAIAASIMLLLSVFVAPISASAAPTVPVAAVPTMVGPVILLSVADADVMTVLSVSGGTLQHVNVGLPANSIGRKADNSGGGNSVDAYLSTAAVRQIADVYGLKTATSSDGSAIAVVSADGKSMSVMAMGSPAIIAVSSYTMVPFDLSNSPYLFGGIAYWPVDFVSSWPMNGNVELSWMTDPNGNIAIWPYRLQPSQAQSQNQNQATY